MQVLTKEETCCNDLLDLIKSNFSCYGTSVNISRIKNKAESNVCAPVSDFEWPPSRKLTPSERDSIFKLTLRLGNQMFYNPEEEPENKRFSHEYSLRYIKLSDEMLNEIRKANGNTIFFETVTK